MSENGPHEDAGWFATNLQHLSDTVIVVAADTTILWANEAVEQTLGWKPEEVIGRSFAEYVHPDDLGRAAEVASLVDQEVFADDSVKPALYRARHANGRWVTVELNSSHRASEAGEIIVICRFGGDLVHGSRLLEAVTSGAPLGEQLRIALDLGRWRYPNEGYVIYHRTPDGYAAVPAPGVPEELVRASLDDPGPWRAALDSSTAVEIVDLTDASARAGRISDSLAETALAAGYRACLAVPVVDDGYDEDAAIVVWSLKSGSSLVGHRYAVSTMEQSLTLVLQQQAHRLRLEKAAYTDHLTGLVSRRRFLDLLGEADRRRGPDGRHVAMYVDLDSFKQVNDALGHRIGDHVLAVAAARISAALPAGSIVGRLGGDEFGVLCPSGTTPDEAEQFAAAVREATAEPIAYETGRTVVGATIGISVGEDGQPAVDVLDAADRALLAAKAEVSGRSRLGSH